MSTKRTSAPKAQSLPSISINTATALVPALETLLASIRAALEQGRAEAETAPAAAAEAHSCHPQDRTDNRIRAYLASVRPMRDCDFRDDIAEANARGGALIERLALSAEGAGAPQLRLTGAQAADVLSFMSCTEPAEFKGWWSDAHDGPSWVCGYQYVLRALEASLRGPREESTRGEHVAADVSELPEWLTDHLQEQQTRVAELMSLLKRLDEDCNVMYSRIAVRMAEELEIALDQTTLRQVMAAELRMDEELARRAQEEAQPA